RSCSLGLQLRQQTDHFQGRQRSFGTLVTRLGAGTFDGLFDGVDGQYAEGDRHTVFHGDLGQALGALAGDVFEVRSTAADDRAEGDDRGIFATLSDLLGHQRNLEGTRRTDDGDVALANTVANQGVDRSEEHTSELQSRENLVCRLL